MSAPTPSTPQVQARPDAPPRSGMVRLSCPLCGKRYKVSRELVGHVGECLHCTGRFIIPPGLPPAAEARPAPSAVGIPLDAGHDAHDHPRSLSDDDHAADAGTHSSVPIEIPPRGHGISAFASALSHRPVGVALGSLSLVLLATLALRPELLHNLLDPGWWGVSRSESAPFAPPPMRSLAIENHYPASSRATQRATTEPAAPQLSLIDDDLLPHPADPEAFHTSAPTPEADDEIASIIAGAGRPAPAKDGAKGPAGLSQAADSPVVAANRRLGLDAHDNPPADMNAPGARSQAAGLVYWAPSSDPVELSNVRVRLLSVRRGPVAVQHVLDGMVSQTPESYLSVEIEVTNLDESLPVDYTTWAGSELSLGGDLAALRDDRDQPLQRVVFTAAVKPRGRRDRVTIGPGLAMTDVLVFAPPQGDCAYLRLELPGRNVGLNVPVRFEVPSAVVRH